MVTSASRSPLTYTIRSSRKLSMNARPVRIPMPVPQREKLMRNSRIASLPTEGVLGGKTIGHPSHALVGSLRLLVSIRNRKRGGHREHTEHERGMSTLWIGARKEMA